jgi:hypothetical protein
MDVSANAGLTTLNIISIITTGILVFAAILTYLIQRARYLREIEPDLELKWLNCFRNIRLGSTFNEMWSFYVDIEVENLSGNHARDLEYEVKLDIFPHMGKPQICRCQMYKGSVAHTQELLAKRKTIIPVYIGKNFVKKYMYFENLTGAKTLEAGFHATIIFSYFSKRELNLGCLVPWRFGKPKYYRKIFAQWYFDIDEMTQSINAHWWEHPIYSKQAQQNVSDRE